MKQPGGLLVCGRFARYQSLSTWHESLGLALVDRLTGTDRDDTPRYNIAPSQWVAAIAGTPEDRSRLTMQALYWGFMPSWAEKPKHARINARSETAATKPFFRKAFHRRRCLIAADCWYEWQSGPDGKQPHAIRPADGAPFFLAGLWSVARNLPDTHPASGACTATILTTQADAAIAPIHQRMPVALTPAGARAWLESEDDTARLQQCLVNGRHAQFEAWPVSTRVNRPALDDATLINPV